MTAKSGEPIRLVASGGVLVDEPRAALTSRGHVDLTVQEIRAGHVVCTGEGGAGTADRTYTVLAEEALHLAVRTLLAPGEQLVITRTRLETPTILRDIGLLEAVASAVRLGQHTTTATVTLHAGGVLIGRGGLVALVRQPARRDDAIPSIRVV